MASSDHIAFEVVGRGENVDVPLEWINKEMKKQNMLFDHSGVCLIIPCKDGVVMGIPVIIMGLKRSWWPLGIEASFAVKIIFLRDVFLKYKDHTDVTIARCDREFSQNSAQNAPSVGKPS